MLGRLAAAFKRAGYCDATAIAASTRRGCIAWRIRLFLRRRTCCISAHRQQWLLGVRCHRLSSRCTRWQPAIDQVTRRIVRDAVSTRIAGFHCQEADAPGRASGIPSPARLLAKAHGSSGARTCLQAPGGTFIRRSPSDTATHQRDAATRRGPSTGVASTLAFEHQRRRQDAETKPRCGMRIICDGSGYCADSAACLPRSCRRCLWG